ncbi:MAG: hypothetical protein U5L75_00125 [Candidatus Campbellbacteria bacterium]|nr:hypothetical protein [Candidatus Campbellbacteria bacterium]
MKKIGLLLVPFVLLFLGACTQLNQQPKDGNSGENAVTPQAFLVAVDNSTYQDNQDRTWSWADARSRADVDIGEELTIVYGYVRGTYRVELGEWNTTDTDVSDLPVVHTHNFGDQESVETFNWTPQRSGEYHFVLYLSDKSGNNRSGSPIEIVVNVGSQDDDNGDNDSDKDTDGGNDDSGDDDGDDGNSDHGGDDNDDHNDDEDNDTGNNDPNLIDYLNVTDSDGSHVRDNDDVDVDDGKGFSVNWGAVSSADDAELTIRVDGHRIYSSTRESHSKYISFSDYDDGEVVVRLEVERDDDRDVETIRFDLVGGSDPSNGSGRIDFDVRVTGGDLEPEDFPLELEASDGAYVDTYRDGDRARVNEGRYYINAPSNLGYDLDRVRQDCTKVNDFRIRVNVDEGETVDCVLYFEFEDHDSDPNLIDYLNVTDSDGSHVRDNDDVDVDDGKGFSVNWGAVSSADDAELTIRVDDLEIYSSTRESHSKYISFSDYDDGEVVVRLEVERDDDRDVETIRFDLVGGESGSSLGNYVFEIDRAVSFTVYERSSGELISRDIEDGEKVFVEENNYRAVLDDNQDFVVDSVTGDNCTKTTDAIVDLRVDDGEETRCVIDVEPR